MADSYKTMKRTGVIPENEGEEYGPLRPYECEVCHGVSLDRCQDPGELTCILCNENAPLPERFRMALGTLGQLCMQRGLRVDLNPITYSFGSFNVTVRDPDYIVTLGLDLVEWVWVNFDYEGETVLAHKDGFMVNTGDGAEDRLFADGLDAGGDRFTPRILAQEVVDRVRHDLELKYAKEA